MQSPSMDDYDPLPAIHLWLVGGRRSRRPEVLPYGKRDCATVRHDQEETTSSDIEVCDSDSEVCDSE